MAKNKAIEFVCQECGTVYPKWQGKCETCGKWNSIVEEKKPTDEFSNISHNKKGQVMTCSFLLIIYKYLFY